MEEISAPPVTRRESNRQRRREAILAMAHAMFAESGYGGTTMSDIAQRLGGSKGTLWNYFPSKEQLFVAVVDRAAETFRARLATALRHDGDHTAALRRFCEQFLATVSAPDGIALHRMAVGECRRFPETGRVFHERAQRRTQSMLADYLGRLQGRGLLRDSPPLEAARHLIALTMSGAYQQVLTGNLRELSADQARNDVAVALRVFLAAYAPDRADA